MRTLCAYICTHTLISVSVSKSLPLSHTHRLHTHARTHTPVSGLLSHCRTNALAHTHTERALRSKGGNSKKKYCGCCLPSHGRFVSFPLVQPDRINKCQSLMLRWSVAVGNPGERAQLLTMRKESRSRGFKQRSLCLPGLTPYR